MIRSVGLLVLLGVTLPLGAEIISRSCSTSTDECQYLIVDSGWVKLGRQSPDADQAQVVGPYLHEYQHLVSSTEAATKEFVSAGGWRVVVTRGFETEYRLAGSTFYLYFFDPQGALMLKSKGDLFLEQARVGQLFGTSAEFFVVSMRSEVGDSYTTQAWILPRQGAPRSVMDTDGVLTSVVVAGVKGLRILSPGHRQERGRQTLWKWDESSQLFKRD
jgi:hypothetical protein